jgi:Glutaredoxin-like domain (DUF836)
LKSLLLVGKPDCHLCHELREVAQAVASSLGLDLEERDLADDPELERRYLLEIPVLLFDGFEVARYPTTQEQLCARLTQLLGSRA